MINIYVGIIGTKNKFKVILVIIESENKKEVYREIDESTSNRAIISAIDDILRKINDKSDVNVFVPTNFGFKYMDKLYKGKGVGNWINKDIGMILNKTIKEKHLVVKFINYGEEEKSEFIKALKVKLKNKYNNKKYILNENKIYNKNDLNKNEVSFYVRGITDFSTEERISKYIVIMNYKGIEKEIYKTINNTTPNRIIIQGIIDAIQNLKKPCHIKLYTQTLIGLSIFNRNGGGSNKDMISVLFDNIKKGNHSLEEFICGNRQEELDNKLRRYEI